MDWVKYGLLGLAVAVGFYKITKYQVRQKQTIMQLQSQLRHEVWKLDGLYYVDDPWGSRWMVFKDSCQLVWRGNTANSAQSNNRLQR